MQFGGRNVPGYEINYDEGIGGPVQGGWSAADTARMLGGGPGPGGGYGGGGGGAGYYNGVWWPYDPNSYSGGGYTPAPTLPSPAVGVGVNFANPVMGQIYNNMVRLTGGNWTGSYDPMAPKGDPSWHTSEPLVAKLLSGGTGGPAYGIYEGMESGQPGAIGMVSPVSDQLYGTGRLGGGGVSSTATPAQMRASLGYGTAGLGGAGLPTPSFDQSWLQGRQGEPNLPELFTQTKMRPAFEPRSVGTAGSSPYWSFQQLYGPDEKRLNGPPLPQPFIVDNGSPVRSYSSPTTSPAGRPFIV